MLSGKKTKMLQHVVVAIDGSHFYSAKYVVSCSLSMTLCSPKIIACVFVIITFIVFMAYTVYPDSIAEGVVEYSVTGVLRVGVSWTRTTWSRTPPFMKDSHPTHYIASAPLATISSTQMYPAGSKAYTLRPWNVS
jgi:hypothetical protein